MCPNSLRSRHAMAVFHAIVSSQKEEPDAFIDTTSAFAHKLVAYAALGLAGVRGLRGGGEGLQTSCKRFSLFPCLSPLQGHGSSLLNSAAARNDCSDSSGVCFPTVSVGLSREWPGRCVFFLLLHIVSFDFLLVCLWSCVCMC